MLLNIIENLSKYLDCFLFVWSGHVYVIFLQIAFGRAANSSGRLAIYDAGQSQISPWIPQSHQETHGLLHHTGETFQQPVCISAQTKTTFSY